jgi:hypothetical protein
MMATDDRVPGTFEDRLLVELTALVADQSQQPAPTDLVARRRGVRRPVLLVGAAAAVVAAAAAVVLPSVLSGGHGAASAYAVTRQSGGTIALTVRGLIPNTGVMQSDLRAAGAGPVRVVSASDHGSCHPGSENLPMPAGLLRGTGPNAFVIDPARLPAGDVLIASVPTHSGAPERVSLTLSRDGTAPCS